jgi:hypothetical protein
MTCERSATSLTKFAATMRDPDPDGARKAASQAWHTMGIAVFFDGDCHGLDREFIHAVANRLYGKRG